MRKKVLILGHNYATQFIDVYNQYTRLFDQDKYEVTVAYLTGSYQQEVVQRTLAEQILFLDIPKRHIRYLKVKAIKTLLQLTREKNFDIVICHRYKPTYIMLWVAKFHPISALVCVMHELKTMSSKARQFLVACLAGKNVLFAGVSNAVRDDIRRGLWNIPPERVATLYNMIDVEQTEPDILSKVDARDALNLSADDFVFGNIARLAHNKDQKSLIQAFATIKAHCPRAKLLIMGDGELESKLKQQVADLGLSHDIMFTGFVANGFRYMKAFNCFVLSSTQEAFGRVLLEAMLAKLPIIATHVNGIPEVVADVGVLVTPNNPHELANAMQSIYQLSQSEQQQHGENAYQHVLNNFSIPAFRKQFWQTLTALRHEVAI